MSSSSTNSRRIAPAPSPTADEAAPSRGGPGAQAGKSGITRASTACQSCKQIKRKCDQQHPCSNCVKTGTECIYDQAQDGRRRAARKRNVEELELKRDALDTILEALRDSDEEHVQHLLRMIRDNVPLSEIIHYASANTQYIPEDQLASLAVAVDTNLSRKSVLSIHALVDTPPIRVSAEPWTNVTNDDDLVSHLVSVYFTWFHPTYTCLHRELFISEMIAADLSSSYCTPMLVNTILATACQLSDHNGAYHLPGDQSSRGKHFLNAAIAQWNDQAGRPSLAALQAGQLLALVLTLVGRDRQSMSYIDQLNDMGPELLIKEERSGQLTDSPDMRKSLSLSMWSLHQMSVYFSLSFMRPRSYEAPAVERLDENDEVFKPDSKWKPYPDSEPEVHTYFGRFATFLYQLHEIGADISRHLFDVKHERHQGSASLQELDDRLRAFSDSLPVADEGEVLDPHVMNLYLVYHWIRVTLFNFFKGPDSPAGVLHKVDDLRRYAQQKCLESARLVVGFYKRYFRDFGTKYFTICMPQSAIIIAYTLIEDLDGSPDVQELFYQVCLVITVAAKKWFFMRGHARMLFITAEHKGQEFEPRTRQLLSHIALEAWRPDGHRYFESSIFPNYALARGDGPRTAGMGDLLEQWAHFHVRDDVDGKHDRTPIGDLDGARAAFVRERDTSESTTATDREQDPQYEPRRRYPGR